MSCGFCREYEDTKTFNEIGDRMDVVFSVKLVASYEKDGRQHGQLTYGNKKLNFCPVCGRKLNA